MIVSESTDENPIGYQIACENVPCLINPFTPMIADQGTVTDSWNRRAASPTTLVSERNQLRQRIEEAATQLEIALGSGIPRVWIRDVLAILAPPAQKTEIKE